MVSLASLGLLGYLFVRASVNHSFEDHATFASMISSEIDYNLEANITRLLDIHLSGKIDMADGDMSPEREALKTVHTYSIFSDGVFLVNRRGDVMLTYPYRLDELVNALSIPAIERALHGGQVVVSDVYTDARTGKKYIYVVVPIKELSGRIYGAVGGMIDPTRYVFSQVIRNSPHESTHIIDLVDSHGAVIASSHLDRILTLSDHNRFMEGLIASGSPATVRCHRCHMDDQGREMPERTDILVFSPLSIAPWGVAIRMPEKEAFRPTSGLVRAILAIGAVLIASALFLAASLSRSIADPVLSLTKATREIASGELDKQVLVNGEDEIGELAESLESMRKKLNVLVRESYKYSELLEEEVAERTQEVVQRKKQLASLLDEIIVTQEDERRRIAQELHDDTAQTIAAIGMSLDVAVHALANSELKPTMLIDLRQKVNSLLDGIGRIIKDLRPSVLDDLGLESALRWMLDRQLMSRGLGYYLDAEDMDNIILDKKSELSVFRMIQEALSNVVKHSEATHVSLAVKKKGDEIIIEVIDNGVGFNLADVNRSVSSDDLKGFGLLGIRERVEQMGGEMEIVSSPGEGTGIYIIVPAKGPDLEAVNGKD